jgi:hypothetical protein
VFWPVSFFFVQITFADKNGVFLIVIDYLHAVFAALNLLSFRARIYRTQDYYSANKHEEYFEHLTAFVMASDRIQILIA